MESGDGGINSSKQILGHSERGKCREKVTHLGPEINSRDSCQTYTALNVIETLNYNFFISGNYCETFIILPKVKHRIWINSKEE